MAAPDLEEGDTGRRFVKPVRDREDLLRAARVVAEHFPADRVIIVASQAILLTWPDAPVVMKITPEIVFYPGNIRDRQLRNPGFEASEEISVLSRHLPPALGFRSGLHWNPDNFVMRNA